MKKLFLFFLSVVLIPGISLAQWATVNNGSNAKRAAIQFSAPDNSTIWATLDDGNFIDNCNEITGSSDGGNTWTVRQVNIGDNYKVNAVFALDNIHIWTVLEADTGGGCIAYSANAGLSWTRQDSAVFYDSPVWIHFWNDTVGLAVGNPVDHRFEIFTTTTGGLDWEKVSNADIPVSLDEEIGFTNSFCVIGDTVLFAGETNGKIYASYNKGKEWSYLPFPMTDIKKVIFMDTSTFIAGSPGISGMDWDLYITYDWAQHWEKIPGDGTVYAADLCGVPGAGNVLVSAGTGLSYSNDLGITWKSFNGPVTNPSPFYNVILFTDLTHGWAGGVNPTDGVGGISKYTGPAMSIFEPVNELTASIYPNPCSDRVTLRINPSEKTPAGNYLYHIADITGRIILSGNIPTSEQSINLDVSSLTPGYYLMTLDGVHNSLQKELIVR